MSTEPIYNEYTVKKFIHLCSFGLVKGLGRPIEGKMCVEAAIALAHNLPHQDKNPSCVDNDVATVKIALNDCHWSSNEARAKGMVAIGIAQLGSNEIVKGLFVEKLKLNSMKMILPYLIQKHYENQKDEKILEWKVKFEKLEVLDDNLWKEFYSNYYYNYYFNHYGYYYYGYYNHYGYYYYGYFGEEFLLLVASTILQTLKDINSPGCKYLYLLGEVK